MSSLNDAITAQVTKLESEAATIKAEAATKVAALEAEITATKGHFTTLAPWLQHEVTAAETAIGAFFAKLKAL